MEDQNPQPPISGLTLGALRPHTFAIFNGPLSLLRDLGSQVSFQRVWSQGLEFWDRPSSEYLGDWT